MRASAFAPIVHGSQPRDGRIIPGIAPSLEIVLQRDGVTLRPWRESDVAQFRDACQDNSVSRWTGFPFDLTETETVNLVRDRIAAARDRTGAAFAVVGADDRLLGSASLFQIDWHRSLGVVAYWLAPLEPGERDRLAGSQCALRVGFSFASTSPA